MKGSATFACLAWSSCFRNVWKKFLKEPVRATRMFHAKALVANEYKSLLLVSLNCMKPARTSVFSSQLRNSVLNKTRYTVLLGAGFNIGLANSSREINIWKNQQYSSCAEDNCQLFRFRSYNETRIYRKTSTASSWVYRIQSRKGCFATSCFSVLPMICSSWPPNPGHSFLSLVGW